MSQLSTTVKIEITELAFDIKELPDYTLDTIIELVSGIQGEYPNIVFMYLSPDNYRKLRKVKRALPLFRIKKGTGKRNIIIAQRVAE